MTPLRIAMVVHGRFHAFDLARALLDRGHAVTLLTNHPPASPARFGIPPARVVSGWPEGLVDRVAGRLAGQGLCPYPEPLLCTWFGRWAAARLAGTRWDVVHCWSGIAEEPFRALAGASGMRLLVRGSSHIRAQAGILADEARRVGRPVPGPSPWMMAREEREYALADRIRVSSQFAYRTFLEAGVPAEKLWLLPLGTSVAAFRPAPAVVEARRRRLAAGDPLRVLYVGALSFRKGVWDLAAVARQLPASAFRVRLVGATPPEGRGIVAALPGHVEVVPAQPQAALPAQYAWADLFLFPTLEDGFAVVLAQAAAAGLPIITTPHCAGPDLLAEGETGWIVPIRAPGAILERLAWCAHHRDALAAMAGRIGATYRPRDWADVAAEFERACEGLSR